MGRSRQEETLSDERGASLIETILFMVVLSFGLIGVLTLFVTGMAGGSDPVASVTAAHLAQEKMDRILAERRYRAGSAGYDWINSTNLPPSPPESVLVGSLTYRRTTAIQEVSETDFQVAAAGSGYKRVTVEVSWGNGKVTMENLYTRY